MRKAGTEKTVRRNITLPASFAVRLEALKAARGGQSESEILRQAISLLEAATADHRTIVLRDKATGKEAELVVL